MTVLWSTSGLPGQRWNPEPEPDDEDGPWCRAPGLLPEQHVTVIKPPEDYL